jgi:hypothetical protein
MGVTVNSETEHTAGVAELKATVSKLLDVADTVKALFEAARVLLPGELNVIV